MGVPGNANALLLKSAAGGGYQVQRSIRLNSADSAHLSRTPGSAGNRKTWTWAGWVKRSKGGARQGLFGSLPTTSIFTALEFDETDKLNIYDSSIGGIVSRTTSAVYRDFSAWMHVVLAYDTTNATAVQRVKLYVNGSEITAFSVSADPPLNADTQINAAQQHVIGSELPAGGIYLDGYLADIHFIDGQALDPTSFGEFDTNGIWQPKAFAGTYGTNGFRLDFSDNSAATATTLGKDRAGSNNWTPNNLSVTAGAGNDSLVDVPTNGAQTDTGVGGEVRGNYCTLNPLDAVATGTKTNGNLDLTSSHGMGTFFIDSGKWYYEFTPSAVGQWVGWSLYNYASNLANLTAYKSDGTQYNGSTWVAYGATYAVNDVIGIAIDRTANTVQYFKNGVSQGVISRTLSGLTAPICFDPGVASFGQRPFAYTAPSGFKALNTANLPAPVVTKPSTVMDVALYTGNNTARSITGLGFSPDFVWIKGRSGATDHALYDAVRGVQKDLVSNSTAAETTQTTGLTAFNSDGFSIGTLAKLNTNAATYAAWAWDAETTTTTNTVGSISSQVRANASAGFSVVTYTGTGGNATVGHGLGVAPGMVIGKRRDTTANWQVRHTSIDAASSIQLNLTNAAASATTVWNSTAPSSTVFSIGTDATVNASGATYVAYCFAPVAGYSSFGSYTGNGSANGPFVYLGFRPAFVLVKMSSGTGNWTMLDAKRKGYNVDNDPLFPNLANAEGTTDLIDITSNGFKVRTTDATFNTNAGTYIYAAWAESPFQYSRAR